MKKIISVLMALAIILSVGTAALADTYNGNVSPDSVLLVNADTGDVLFEKNAQSRVYPASTTKLITALIVTECCPDLDAVVTVSAKDLEGIYYGADSTLSPMLSEGEQISVRELLYGLLLASGNDAASTLARFVAGTGDRFVAHMNTKAAELGMSQTHFSNSYGIHDENHYTTAADMSLLAREVLKNETIMGIVGQTSHTIPATNKAGARNVTSTNRLLCDSNKEPEQNGHIYGYATGMKTGSTPSAHGCLVASAERDGVRLICLVYGDRSENETDRFSVASELFEYGFSNIAQAAVSSAANGGNEAPRAGHPFWRVVCILFSVIFAVSAVFAALVIAKNLLDEKKRLRLSEARKKKGQFPYRLREGETERDAIRRERKRKARFRGFLRRWIAIAVVFLTLFIVFLVLAAKCKAPQISAEDPQASAKPAFSAEASAQTSPEAMQVSWEIFEGTKAVSEFSRKTPISFGEPNEYFALNGVSTFRGNNYRSDPGFGTAQISTGRFSGFLWDITTDTIMTSDGNGAWTGSGWTGQPLVVKWDEETKSHMNIYASKKAKEGLTELIYATLDGHIYFLDIDDGEKTRDTLNVGMCFKGSGSLDPRGYPLMYVGSGDGTVDGERPKMYVISLIDGKILYTYGDNDPQSLRTDNKNWTAFDSSPLVDAETDTLIWPGENGILYTIKLNTSYDKSTGSLSVSPSVEAKTRYRTPRSGEQSYWYGYECSADIIDHYIYLSENGGMFYCVDLNTMKLVWAQDTKDDSNSSPVVQYDKTTGEYYIYTAPSLHWTKNADYMGSTTVYKLNARTGEIVWSNNYPCCTVEGVSGGVQATPLLGREGTDIENMIIYPIARTPGFGNGILVALDTKTGAECWRLSMDDYTWSSPVAVYGDDGRALVVVFDSAGKGFLLDGKTGAKLDTVDVGYLVEASPVVYGDKVIIGTRGQKVYCMSVY